MTQKEWKDKDVTIECLDKMEALFDKRGWYQGEYEARRGGPVCMLGCYALACCGHKGVWLDDIYGEYWIRKFSQLSGRAGHSDTGEGITEENDLQGRDFAYIKKWIADMRAVLVADAEKQGLTGESS